MYLKMNLGLYSCPIQILSRTKHIISGPLAPIINMLKKGVFFFFLAEKKGMFSPFIRATMNLTLVITD